MGGAFRRGNMITDWHFYALALPAVFLMGLSKGGFAGLSLLSTPLVALVISPVKAAAIMLPILIAQDVVSVWAYRRDWSARNLAIMLPGCAIGILIGYLMASRVSDSFVRLIVGIIAISFVLAFVIKSWRRRETAAAPADVAPGIFWGGVAGFTSFISHAGGVPFQVYVMPQKLSPPVYVGTNAIFFAINNLLKVLPYILLGQFSAENLSTSAALLPVAVAATFAGVWLVRHVPADRFFTIIYALTFCVGLTLLWDGAGHLF
jgi:uncharacterized membrane protein YfcA